MTKKTVLMACTALVLALAACNGDGGDDAPPPVTIDAGTPNTVSIWSETAATTVNQPNAAIGTPEERSANYAFDLASVHVAMYDAVVAIAGGRAPLIATPAAPVSGASQEAAAAAGAYTVLRGLFPSRASLYQPTYDASLASVTDATARERGVAVGTEVGTAVLAARANDGRLTALPTFVAGVAPGQYRGPGTVGRSRPFVRTFALTSAGQFRAPGPNALTSPAYAADFAETASLGAASSGARTAAQATSARFHSEPPTFFWPRNFRPLMMRPQSLAENARIGAMLWASHADAIIACFESKWLYLHWRPFSAIPLGTDDGNPLTTADPAWTPFLPTPGHPEYPAAHGCAAGAAGETIARYFGTRQVSFELSSTVSGSTQRYADIDAFIADVTIARIAGGMHFRRAMVDGEAIGTKSAAWLAEQKMLRR